MTQKSSEQDSIAQNIPVASTPLVANNNDNAEQLAAIIDDLEKRYNLVFRPLIVADTKLEILQIRDTKEHIAQLMKNRAQKNPMAQLPLWAKIWPASFVLDRFLRKADAQGQSLLEIGAGCGSLGLSASQYGFSQVTISDIHPDALLFAKANVLHNKLQERVTVSRIDITEARLEKRFDYIVGSELLSQENMHRPLCKFLLRHLARNENATAFFCHDTRRKIGRFFKLAGRDFLVAEQVVSLKTTNQDGTEERQNYSIHRLRHKHV